MYQTLFLTNANMPRIVRFSSEPSDITKEIGPETKISEIPPIEENRNQEILHADMLDELVEYPLLRPCRDLWNKGIQTLTSSANQKDLEIGHTHLVVDWDSLSEENKEIAKSVATKIGLGDLPFLRREDVLQRVVLVEPDKRYDGRGFVEIAIPLNENSTAQDIEKQVSEITDQFKKQPAKWVKGVSYDELREYYCLSPEDETTREDFVNHGYYWDEDSDLFYRSKELFLLKTGKVLTPVVEDQ
jgi:hypothetical protein